MDHSFSQEENLIAELKANNHAAFEYLYRHYKYWMFLEVFVILKDEHASRDLVQDLMIDFWHHKLYQSISLNLKGYLIRMLRNRALNYVRDKRRLAKKETDFINIQLQIPETENETSPLKDKLREAIERLPPKTHAVFMQFYIEGLSQRQIADSMSISPNTVNNHLEKARQLVRNFFKKNLELE